MLTSLVPSPRLVRLVACFLTVIPASAIGQAPVQAEPVRAVEGTFPQATIGNGIVQATLYLPDAERGYYRGSRFDWSGVVGRLTFAGHSYVDQWFPRYDPRTHDAITGPVESFAPIGFNSAAPGEPFLAIGIGVLRKPDTNGYRFQYPYEIINGGKWTTTVGPDRVESIHELTDGAGQAYVYSKIVRLVPGRPVMLIEHRLRNAGTRPLATNVFNHNFFIFDGQPTGSALSVTFPFTLQSVGMTRGFGMLADVQNNRIVYRRDLASGETVSSEFQGFGASPSDYDVRMENRVSGAGMRITADRPMSRLNYWSIRTTACPEPYIDVNVAPGAEFTWTISYELYEVGQ